MPPVPPLDPATTAPSLLDLAAKIADVIGAVAALIAVMLFWLYRPRRLLARAKTQEPSRVSINARFTRLVAASWRARRMVNRRRKKSLKLIETGVAKKKLFKTGHNRGGKKEVL